MKSAFGFFAAALALLGSTGAARADVVSTFDTDSQGWSLVSFADLPSSNYAIDGTYAVVYSATGGNGGGYVGSNDPDGGDYTFSAPSAYLGDIAAATGLSYDVIRPADGVNYQTTDVMIVGANGTRLLWQANPAIVPGPAWTSVSLAFAPGANWLVDTTGGALATSADFQAVLADVSGIFIRGEYAFGDDDTGLDNIRLAGVGVSAVPEPSQPALLCAGLGALALTLRRQRRG